MTEIKCNSFEEFTAEAKKLYGKRFYYYPGFVDMDTELLISCWRHGRFRQTPKAHLTVGCLTCDARVKALKFIRSSIELITDNFIITQGEPVKINGKIRRFDFALTFLEIKSKFGEKTSIKKTGKCRIDFDDRSHFENKRVQAIDHEKTFWSLKEGVPVVRLDYEVLNENSWRLKEIITKGIYGKDELFVSDVKMYKHLLESPENKERNKSFAAKAFDYLKKKLGK